MFVIFIVGYLPFLREWRSAFVSFNIILHAYFPSSSRRAGGSIIDPC